MTGLHEKSVSSKHGITYYWTNVIKSDIALVLLPGLTADHQLFETQISCFEDEFKVLVWDCPCHGKSRPYDEFTYANVCNELDSILKIEGIAEPYLLDSRLEE